MTGGFYHSPPEHCEQLHCSVFRKSTILIAKCIKSAGFRPDERPSAPEITHKILDLHTRLFESPAERLWQRYVMDQTLSVKRFNSIIQYEPIESDCDSFNNIAVSYFKRDKYEESIKLWDKGKLTIFPLSKALSQP